MLWWSPGQGTRQWEGAWCLTAIPALQNLAAHGVLGGLGAAQVLAVDPEAGVVLLHQVAVVPDHCGTGGEVWVCVSQGCVPSLLQELSAPSMQVVSYIKSFPLSWAAVPRALMVSFPSA